MNIEIGYMKIIHCQEKSIIHVHIDISPSVNVQDVSQPILTSYSSSPRLPRYTYHPMNPSDSPVPASSSINPPVSVVLPEDDNNVF